MQKITPCFWFNNQADEAVAYYLSIFNDSSIKETSHYTDEGPGQKGTTLAITFQLNGQEFMAINGGPEYQFTPALSLYVSCEDQGQVDYY